MPKKFWKQHDPGVCVTKDDDGRPAATFLRSFDGLAEINARSDGVCELFIARGSTLDVVRAHPKTPGRPKDCFIDSLHIRDLRAFIEQLEEACDEFVEVFCDAEEWDGQAREYP